MPAARTRAKAWSNSRRRQSEGQVLAPGGAPWRHLQGEVLCHPQHVEGRRLTFVAEAQDVGIEGDGLLPVVDREDQVVQFDRHRTGPGTVRLAR